MSSEGPKKALPRVRRRDGRGRPPRNRDRPREGGSPHGDGIVASHDPVTRALVREVLSGLGFSLRELTSVREIEELPPDARPHLAVLDTTMPGLEIGPACSALRGDPGGERVRVLALIGREEPDAIGQALDGGVTDFAVMPQSAPILAQRVRHMLRAGAILDELRKSETTLETAQRLARLGNWEWDVVSGEIHWSSEARRLLGSPPELPRPSFREFMSRVHPEDAPLFRRSLDVAMRGEGLFSVDHRIVLEDGSVRWVHCQAEVTRDAQGAPVRLSGAIQDITERKRAESQIRYLAFYDALTGLPNRLHFNDQLAKALALARRSQRLVALMFLDLDNFKRINDTAGHSVGDRLLRAAAARLKEIVRSSDTVARRSSTEGAGTVARVGGDEFLVLLPDISRAEDTARVACRFLDSFRAPFQIDQNEVFTSTSIGICIFPQDGADPEELLKNADAALYHAKDSGRNNFQFYDPSLNDAAFRHLSLESSLRRAVERDELLIHYQPQVRARDGRLVGVEALVRWNHPDLGLVFPSQFIRLAEETGLIRSIDEWVLREACLQNMKWQEAGLPAVRVAVNLSGSQFHQKDLVARVDAALGASRLDPRFVELEITESVLMESAAETVEVLNQLKIRGFRIAVDDFGTGYSSLSYLKRFGADVLKIDRSFVRDIATNPDDAAIVAAIITLAETLKMDAIAEGVENALQRSCLHEQGCDLMQGYLFGKPVPAEEIERLLKLQTGDASRALAAPHAVLTA